MNDEIDGKSLDLKAQRLAQLREIFPEFFSEGRLDLAAVKEVLGDDELTTQDRYELSWAGKAESRREIQKQTTATLIPEKEASINFDTSENIFIEGENLEALRVLQKAYFGKVKMIYLDPPYNTGSDSFVYPDDFAERLAEYEKRTGTKNGGGFLNKLDLFKKNTKENGQYHSVWLSMMYPRLYLARNLLRQDGVLFVSIDENEVTNLRLLLNEIFGEENCLQQIVWKRHAGGGNDSKHFAVDHEYILAYAKNKEAVGRLRLPLSEAEKAKFSGKDEHFEKLGGFKTKSFKRMRPDDPRPGLQYEIETPDGNKIFDEWKWEETKFKEALKVNKVQLRKDRDDNWQVEYKIYLYDPSTDDEEEEEREKVPRSLFTDVEKNSAGKKQLRTLLGEDNIFNNPKPVGLIKHLLLFAAKDDAIVLDFFAGSGSTAQAVLEVNQEYGGDRKFICIQMPEATEEESPAFKAGYKTISEICRVRISKAVEALRKNGAENIGFRSYRLHYSNFKQWKAEITDKETLLKQIEIFKEPLLQKPSDSFVLLSELLLKSGVPLSANVETKTTANGTIYYLVDRHSVYALDSLSEELLPAIEAEQPTMFVTLGNLFTGEKADEQMTNWKLQLQESGIEFKLI